MVYICMYQMYVYLYVSSQCNMCLYVLYVLYLYKCICYVRCLYCMYLPYTTLRTTLSPLKASWWGGTAWVPFTTPRCTVTFIWDQTPPTDQVWSTKVHNTRQGVSESGKLASLNSSWQSKEGTFCVLRMEETKPMAKHTQGT